MKNKSKPLKCTWLKNKEFRERELKFSKLFFNEPVLVHVLHEIQNVGAVTKVVEIFGDLTPPSMELKILEISVTVDHKKVPITAFVGMAFEIGRKALKYMLEELKERLVEGYCGERYERDRDYRRNQRDRTIVFG